ncbi:uncharacterized protein VTP21DRAFT_10373 [Calcarisporiella thermophila]|uniref:uncharacterized protein n=1 Tax=Calcarisporiella thermophila TaxID=911321 RepID=UPI0037444FB6
MPAYAQRPAASSVSRMISVVEVQDSPLRFLIFDCPTDSTISLYLKEFHRYNVTDVVRVCEPTYSTAPLEANGIQVHDLPFRDGAAPPVHITKKWLALVEQRYREGNQVTIAVHCVAGLGRACVMVAVALIELGMKPLDAIEYVRRYRRGAFNKKQIEYIDNYKRITKGFKSTPANGAGNSRTSSDISPPLGPTTFRNPFTRMFRARKAPPAALEAH